MTVLEEGDPFLTQAAVGVLSVAMDRCSGVSGACWAQVAAPVTNAASSKSLLVMSPGTLSDDTSRDCMASSKR